MSLIGTFRTSGNVRFLVAIRGKADIAQQPRNVGFCFDFGDTQLGNWGQFFENKRTEAVTSLRDL